MRFRRFSVLIVFFLFFPLIGFTLPQLAVLEAMLAAGIDPAAGPLITSKIEEEFVNSGKYRVLDRANIDEVLREKEFQLSSGIVRNEEIRQAGEYLGADFVVAVNVSRVGQTFVVAAKMIDVVSGEIAAQTSYERQGRIDVLLDIAKVVGGRLAGTEIVMIEVEEPKSEEPEKEEVVKATKVEPAARPQRERKPVEFKRFVVGVKAGGNLANIRWDDAYLYGDNPGPVVGEEPYSIFGFMAGAYFTVNFSSYLGMQTEVLFSQKGYQLYAYDWYYDLYPLEGYVTTKWKFNYIELPVLVKVGFPGKFSVYAVAGASFSLFMWGTVENVYDDPTAQDDFDYYYDNPMDFEDYLSTYWGSSANSFDAGIVFGAGLDYVLPSIVVNFEVRYTFGLLTVTTDDFFSNSALTFTGGVGYRF